MRGYDPVLAVLLFCGALALHSRQLDLKLRLDYLWATQVFYSHLRVPTLPISSLKSPTFIHIYIDEDDLKITFKGVLSLFCSSKSLILM